MRTGVRSGNLKSFYIRIQMKSFYIRIQKQWENEMALRLDCDSILQGILTLAL